MATSLRFRGYIYSEKGSIDKAIEDLTLAINFNPTDFYAYAARGNFYSDKGLKDKSCEDYRKAADLGLITIYDIIKENCGDR